MCLHFPVYFDEGFGEKGLHQHKSKLGENLCYTCYIGIVTPWEASPLRMTKCVVFQGVFCLSGGMRRAGKEKDKQ